VGTDSSAKPADDLEEGVVLRPRFDAAGLITCVTTDAATGEVLMVAYMNAEALQKTVESGEAWYFSRSRKALWHKGETSGHVQRVIEIRTDCDQDAIWLRVDQTGGAACHTGRRSCFYRAVVPGEQGGAALKFVDADRLFDPDAVYGKAGHGHSHD
jgi:phosphoribosyl-AMP cyclohydrolase